MEKIIIETLKKAVGQGLQGFWKGEEILLGDNFPILKGGNQ